MKPFGPILLLSLLSFAGAAQSWSLKSDKDGIRVYSRRLPSAKFDEIRVEMSLSTSLEKLASVLYNVAGYPKWGYATRTAKVVKQITPDEFIYYTELDVPWPATDRDMYADFKLTRDSANHRFSIVATAVPDYAPQQPDLVRVPSSLGTWTATTLANKQIHLQYTLRFDPGGSLPAWILNLLADKGPRETFVNLRKQVAP